MRRPSVIQQWLALACALSITVAAVMVYERRIEAAADAPADSGDGHGAVDVPAPPEASAVPEAVDVPAPPEASAVPEAVDMPDVPDPPVPSETDSADIAAVAPPPFPDQFEPSPNEVQADAKRLGAAVAHQITNYGRNSSVTDLAALVTADPARVDALAREAATVHHPGMWSRGTIEYAQLGGHRDDRISIMVVVRQELGKQGTSDAERAETRTMDVRLARGASGVWEFEQLASAGGQPVARPPNLSPLAASVVDDPRIDLPDTAIWDIYSGQTDPALHEVMLDIAERTPYSVIVLKTGHPHNVFGTDRVSNHTVGRAVDIHEVNSALVIDSHDTTSSMYALSEWLVSRLDITEFGSPWLFDDAVAHNFTDEVHHDHLHVGVFSEDHVAG
ncbi:hypothetical protein [Candidatus Poriferisodalis sp.]|uniref:hypothetical protein n=1 Tax=Candidatus Poriferisodalis sp. TaxID=3101277 RepID=UPI003B013132